MNIKRIIILSIFFSSIGCFPLFDYHRVNSDFAELKNFLNEVRFSAIQDGKSYIVRFEDRQTDLYTFNNEFIRSLPISTLSQVNYNTTLGDNMIVFRPGGTNEHNTRVHGGDIRLKSWFGFSKSIAVNCTGFVSEGVYPEDN
ncbi:hypothetical protein [Desulforhopalus sp. IMCC35007]|uniref:hypothetical protein n=1 Tax=Desulforhopalus sp. IMCC35007 TaxID=2569543 RepID=UPI0010ADD54A|nr:hypothetical protein [Desulforhopalus sp. IMCC35007]TKB07457.1 hypothetical protein FCL48_17095 [Desulforhopalus sp. IMCC35007]